MPARRASGLHGTHIQPPDQAVAPPNTGSFSTTTTFWPCQAAVTAADRPAAPEPMTRTSHSSVGGRALAGIVVLREGGLARRASLARIFVFGTWFQ
ncbi:hypothetical protein D3C75_898020 [compost metagenome]